MTPGAASESEVEDEESSPVIEASSPTTADASKLATAPLTTSASSAALATTPKDGEKEGRKFDGGKIKIRSMFLEKPRRIAQSVERPSKVPQVGATLPWVRIPPRHRS